MSLPPLRFHPLIKRRRWGGRRLGSELHKPIGSGNDYAESWELCDRGADQSLVANGPWIGWTLGELVRQCGPELLGRHAGLREFPLLLKFLDASDRLSVQVHPTDQEAARTHPGERGKTEAWVVMEAAQGSCVYAGLSPGVSPQQLREGLHPGTMEDCLHKVHVVRGDCLFIPAGTVHAIGAGVLVAEIQQSSDLTYRLYDWGWLDSDGQPRQLHIEQGLACVDFSRGPVAPSLPRVVKDERGHRVEELVHCPYFTLRRHVLQGSLRWPDDQRCHLLMGVAGEARVGPAAELLRRGDTLLIPAAALPCPIEGDGPAEFLETDWE
ncbi:MAG: type I phosphomannose isomerase catalytic subunit [Planctomycetales bacterium]